MRRPRYFVGNKADPTEPERPKCGGPRRPSAVMGLVGVALPRPLLSIGTRGAGRQRRNGGYGAGLHIDPAAIVINDRGGAARSDHDRVADLGIGLPLDWFEAVALIDQQVALARLNDDSPGWAANEHRAANAKRL